MNESTEQDRAVLHGMIVSEAHKIRRETGIELSRAFSIASESIAKSLGLTVEEVTASESQFFKDIGKKNTERISLDEARAKFPVPDEVAEFFDTSSDSRSDYSDVAAKLNRLALGASLILMFESPDDLVRVQGSLSNIAKVIKRKRNRAHFGLSSSTLATDVFVWAGNAAKPARALKITRTA